MTGIATGVFRTIAVGRQTAKGVPLPPTAGNGKLMRRTTCTLDLAKASYTSAEILQSQQKRDMRHGMRSVTGTMNGEISVGTYQQQFESVLRQRVQANIAAAASMLITAAATTPGQGTLTTTGPSFITSGFCVGDIVTMGGWTAPAVGNNGHYAMITSLTATVMGLLFLDTNSGGVMLAKAAGDPVTVAQVGKKTYLPATGQTRDYYTIEHWFSDINQSELFTDCVFTGFTATLPPTGMATIAFPILGLNMTPAQAEYFLAPSPTSISGIEASVNGALIINGQVAGLVTGLTVDVKGNYTAASAVVGSNVGPDIFPGSNDVTGQVTVYFLDNTFRDLFINETESSLAVALTANNTPNSPFTCFNMSRIKFSGATKDDGNAGLTLTMPYTALENVSTSGATFPNLQTTISIQDALFV